jgi:serine/threonine-protein kinase
MPPDEASSEIESPDGRQRFSLPGYRLGERVGAGRMGTVYRARQVALDRDVAIKVLHPSLSRQAGFRKRFYDEARSVARLSHPHIVTGIDAGAADGVFYFIMEYLGGGTLAGRLREEGPLAPATAATYLAQTASALSHAETVGLIHCDIKPENLMLDATGDLKLTDLGIAQVLTSENQTDRIVRGTPHYISPEQIRLEHPLDSRADLYALGATVFHLLCGEPPFDGEDAKSIALARLREEVPDVRTRRPGVPAPLAGLLRHLMAIDRDERPPNPDALLDRLEAAGLAEVRRPGEGRARASSAPGGSPLAATHQAGAPRTAARTAPSPGRHGAAAAGRGSRSDAAAHERRERHDRPLWVFILAGVVLVGLLLGLLHLLGI